MSRADRRRNARTTRRAAVHLTRRMGCTCTPSLQDFAAGYVVDHQPGCVLGAEVKALNDRGILPGWPLATSCAVQPSGRRDDRSAR